ncbi:hypothetical protein [Dictyobacter aurantiacus]|uniref:Uncharacterized protein n=1 Tax=Dictyobacter aurantiacus TaxID=1936993 RepID=A0A401ZLP9_9CHLR|nr:hypothetical protein [Dictyobacter aurantiacus]GCE02679.1 hypothetical protein KDAU_00080 [Dictyobacter aurantiacus]GCE07768.1 hypothetical protein KDAU_50970 [Dictyobacter aurantiacus]GCE07783.1 hypothetical protein KDAU_51120 [Dictyobacter aurantiacus]GCE10134.1 hypothetical protein KDAU_74630 [Dictyobacter aurantiacus]
MLFGKGVLKDTASELSCHIPGQVPANAAAGVSIQNTRQIHKRILQTDGGKGATQA